MSPYDGYDSRVDANQADHVKALKAAGATVWVMSNAGDGLTDLLVWYKNDFFLIEVKNGKKPPSARKLTPAQAKFHEFFEEAVKAGKLLVSKHPDEAVAAIRRGDG